MIKNLHIKNFKSWEDTSELNFGKLTGFFGTNSSGKTSILQFLLLLKQTTESPDRSQTLDFDRNYVNLGSFKDVIFEHDNSKSIFFRIEWLNETSIKIPDPELNGKYLFQDTELSFESLIGASKSGNIQVKKCSYIFGGYEFEIEYKEEKNKYGLSSRKLDADNNSNFNFKRTQGRAWELPQPYRFYGFPEQVRAYYQNAGFLSILEYSLESQFNQIYYLGPLRDYPQREYSWGGTQPFDMGQRGEKSIDAILSSDEREIKISRGRGKSRLSLEEYVAHWLKELELIYAFDVRPIAEDSNLYRVYVKKNRNSPEVLITDVGFGVSQILPVITLCFYAPPGSILIIEQPEIHLHPKVQAGLADVFIDAINNRQIQIILESHSEHLLKRIQRRIAEEKFLPNDSKIYFCDNKSGKSSISLLNLDIFGNILNWPDRFFGDEMGEMIATNTAIRRRKQRNS